MNTHDVEYYRTLFVNDCLSMLRYASFSDILSDPLGRDLFNRFLRNNDRNIVYQTELDHIHNYQLCSEIMEERLILTNPTLISNMRAMISNWQNPPNQFPILNTPYGQLADEQIEREMCRLQRAILQQMAYLPGCRTFWFNLHLRSHRIKMILRAIFNLHRVRRIFEQANLN